jgi:hypothetical protein
MVRRVVSTLGTRDRPVAASGRVLGIVPGRATSGRLDDPQTGSRRHAPLGQLGITSAQSSS